MWPRVLEILLGAWLLFAPVVLEAAEGAGTPVVSWAAGVAVIALSASTFSERFRRNHLGNLLVAVFLIGWGWSQAPRPGPAWAQNQILVGLLLGLVALVPTQTSRPPASWEKYVETDDSTHT